MEPYDPRWEDRVLAAVPQRPEIPRVMLVRDGSAYVGRPFAVQSWLPGETVPLRAVTDDNERLRYRRSFARALGWLHGTGDAAALGGPATIREALANALEQAVAQHVAALGVAHPAFIIGLRWLRTHLPASSDPPALCHGDFRFQNLRWQGPGELSGILDWERAWVGDPMVDIAFGRRFSGWCAVDGEVEADYLAAGGRSIDEGRVAYGLRFERFRSYTSSWRGGAALREGRSDNLALFGIAEAGDRGVWGLRHWLRPDEPLAPAGDGLPIGSPPTLEPTWLAELEARALAAGERRLAAHLQALPEADARARSRSLAALRAVAQGAGTPRRLSDVLDLEEEHAWGAAFACLAEAAQTGGPELLPALSALALRMTERPSLWEVASDDE